MNRRSPNLETVGALCLVASPLTYEVTRFLWPKGSEGDTATQLAAAAAHPTAQYLAGLLEMFSGWLLLPAVLAVVARLTTRGRVFGRVAGGLTSMAAFGFSGLCALNAFFVVMAEHLPRAEAVALYDKLTSSIYLAPFIVMIFAGVLGQVLLTWAAFRGGLVRGWVPALMTAGAVLVEAASNLEGLPAALVYLPVLGAAALFAAALLRPAPAASVAGARHGAPEPQLAVG